MNANAERLILAPSTALNPDPFYRVAVRYGDRVTFTACRKASEIKTVSNMATAAATDGAFKRWSDLEIQAAIDAD